MSLTDQEDTRPQDWYLAGQSSWYDQKKVQLISFTPYSNHCLSHQYKTDHRTSTDQDKYLASNPHPTDSSKHFSSPLLSERKFHKPIQSRHPTLNLEIRISISTSNPQSQSQSSPTSPNPNYQTSQPRKLTIRSIETQPLISIVIQPSAVVTRAICRIHKSSRWVYLHSDSLLLIESSIRFSAECWMQTCILYLPDIK